MIRQNCKSYLLCFLFIFGVAYINNAFAQNNRYVEYYKIINKAELKIVDSLYNEALKIYESAFKAVSFPYANDFYNAAVCAVLSEDFNKSLYYIDKLVAKGFELNNFEDSVFNPLKKDKKWVHFVKAYPSKRKKHLKSVNLALKQEFERMHEQDQYFRKKEGSYEVYRDTIAKIDKRNIERFLQIVDTYGFPDEQMIGINNIYGQMTYSIVLIHHAQMGTHMQIRDKVTKVLLQAVEEGKFPPEYFASLEDERFAGLAYGSIPYIHRNGKLEGGTVRHEEYVNKSRVKIGLGTMEELRKEILFSQRDKRFFFGNQGGILYIVNKRDAQK
jgi:hypothetical protein